MTLMTQCACNHINYTSFGGRKSKNGNKLYAKGKNTCRGYIDTLYMASASSRTKGVNFITLLTRI